MSEYDGTKKYQVVVVDEYNNWWLCGFYNDLKEALPQVNAYLSQYELDEGEEYPCAGAPTTGSRKIWLGDDSPFGTLEEYPGTFGPCIDRTFSTPEGEIEVRGFVLL